MRFFIGGIATAIISALIMISCSGCELDSAEFNPSCDVTVNSDTTIETVNTAIGTGSETNQPSPLK